MTKPRILALAFALLLAASFTAEAEEVVNVQTWGGSLGESFQKNIVEPFEAETGIKVVLSYGMAADALAKVRAQQANPQVDIAMMGQTEAISLWDEGLLDVLDPAEIPNLGNLVDSAVYADDGGSIFYVGMYGYVLELIYRTDSIENPPKSWGDLWKPEYAGEIMFPSPAVLSAHSQVMAARINGGDESNMEPGWEALKALAPSIVAVYRSDAETYNLIASGEALIGPALMYTTLDLMKAGVPVARVSPAEGSPVSWDGITLVTGAPNAEGAKKLIDFMLSRPVVEAHVNEVATIPAVEGVELEAELAKALPSTEEERSRLLRLDDEVIAAQKADWIARWDREVVPLIGR
jgi:putative spermidine/putrescine transport system substrate-binding protein